MDFEFSADQEMLRDSIRRFLSERAPIATYVRDAYDAQSLGTDEVWKGLSELGITGLLIAEEHGGAGAGMVDAAVALEELGRALCPAPYVASAVGAASLVSAFGTADDRSRLLPGLAAGSTIGCIAAFEPGRRHEWRDPSTVARRGSDAWQLDGEKVHVADAGAADVLLVVARDDVGTAAFAVDTSAPGVEVEPTPTVDGSRKESTVRLAGATGLRLGSGDATAALSTTLDRLAVAYVVDGVGAASRALELAVEYAKERVQFDHPIGSFQAVQHLCADMLRAVELGRAVAYYACWASDDADPTEAHRAATMAKAFASDAFAQVGATAIQVFGGVGFTWEHDIHLFYKRLLTLSVTLGSTDDHLAELARLTLDA